MALLATIVVSGVNTIAQAQTQPASGAVWVDPDGTLSDPRSELSRSC